RQRLAQHRAIRMRARQLLGERPARPGRFKLDDLVVHRLAVCTDPGVANYRAHVPSFALTFRIREMGFYQASGCNRAASEHHQPHLKRRVAASPGYSEHGEASMPELREEIMRWLYPIEP